MGDMADYYIALGLNAGEGFAPRYRERRGYYGPRYSCDLPQAPKKPACKACGSKAVHWRLFDGNYALADDQRQRPGNRYIKHVCPTTADGFGDIDD